MNISGALVVEVLFSSKNVGRMMTRMFIKREKEGIIQVDYN